MESGSDCIVRTNEFCEHFLPELYLERWLGSRARTWLPQPVGVTLPMYSRCLPSGE